MFGLVDLKQIELTTAGVLLARTGQSNEVIFGLSDPDPQLRRWRAVHDQAQKMSKHIAWLDLSVSNNVPVRWQAAGTPAPPPAKPAKTPRSKKKHV